MKKLILSAVVAVISFTLSAQKIYFIYLQAESEQPFYVRFNSKVHSSTAGGYLILSKLQDSTYIFTVGFPQNKWKEQNFSVKIDRKDHGYLLKNFGEKGWGLFNLQTLEVKMALTGTGKEGEPVATEVREVSAFTELLVRATGDPSLKERPSAQPQPVESRAGIALKETPGSEVTVVTGVSVAEAKPVEENPTKEKAVDDKKTMLKAEAQQVKEPQPDKPVIAMVSVEEKKEEPVAEQAIKKEEIKTSVKEEIEPADEGYKASVVTRRSESSTTEGFGLVFIDKYPNGENDTIRLLIPNPKPVVTPVNEQPREERKMLDIAVEVPQTQQKTTDEVKTAAVTVTDNKPSEKTKCKESAEETDFFKLRKQMASVESESEMINEADRYFKTKCFSTKQVKNLGSLFLTDEGRYRFFDAAYSYTSDPENFSVLQEELKDEYYINRFRAMLRN